MNTLIFADVHLKVTPEGRDTLDDFVAFLRRIDPAKYPRIVILGDLFDFWFEYREVIFSGYFDVLRALADLRDGGAELHLICGNHDFWAGRFLRESIGFHIHPDRLEMSFGGRRGLLVHGDGVAPDDYTYRAYKAFARSPLVVGAFRLIHPDWAMRIARAVSHGSRALYGVDDPSQGRQVAYLDRYARNVLAKGECDVLICGHSHYQMRQELPAPEGTATYINTGDWLERRHYVVWNESDFELRQDTPGAII